jgi:hypothetical protein
MRKIQVTSGPAAGHEQELERECVIGRENVDLVIEDDELSRRHVAFRPVAQGVEIEDLGSTNGTFVDGQRISEPVTIAFRGAVKVGMSEIQVDVALPQPTEEVSLAGGQVTRARDVPQARTFDATAPRQVATPPPAQERVQVPAAAPAAPAAPAAEAEPGGVEESPHLPIPASAAIFTAATIAVAVLLFVVD